MVGIELTELNDWLTNQHATWKAWGETQDPAWLNLRSGNERFDTLGALFRHAFTPLHRYSATAIAETPPDDSHIAVTDWPAQIAWAEAGLAKHRAACAAQTAESGDTVMTFQTRSAGPITVKARHALGHAATHCFWHLGGIVQVLRHEGIEPPQRSDFLWYAAGLAATK